MRLGDLKSVLYSEEGYQEDAILFDSQRNVDIEIGKTIDYIIEHHPDVIVKHIQSFENSILITI